MRGEYWAVFFFLLLNSSCGFVQRTYVCPALTLKNGHVRMRQRGRFARFSCNNGYLLSGEKYAACVRGQWEQPLPQCVRPSCTKMRITSPNLYAHASLRGAVMHFSCKPEFQLRGDTISHCDGKKWDKNPPVCQKSGTKPAYLCDFETEDICGWDHDVNHDFDWRRFRYNTPSGHVGTGPSYDHTKGEGKDGHYMYLESSSRFENDTARLISPFYDQSDNNTCFEFYYHMYGATMGTLRVYLKRANDSWEFEPKKAFFEKSGNQGDRWYRSFTSLGLIEQDFQIVIEGIRGSGYVSDIAVDDVRIIENCIPELMTTTESVTVTDSLATETFPLIESCENRCGLFGVTADPIYRITCDCDTDCLERNACCLDYIAFCVLSGTDAAANTTLTTDEDTTPTTIPETTTEKQTSPTAKPTLMLLTPRITERIVERTAITTVPTTPTTTTAKKTMIFMTTAAQQHPNEENEIIKIVRPTTESAAVEDYDEIPRRVTTNLMKKVDEELKEQLSPPVVVKTNMLTERIVKEQQPISAKSIWIVVGVMIALVALLLVAVVFVKMRRLYFFGGFRGIHRRSGGGNGDSQSDVRFLASDEALDFTLPYQ